MFRLKRALRARASLLVVAVGLFVSGCLVPPKTVDAVDLKRYAGLWYQVGGYPFAPSAGLVGITAEYTAREDGDIDVVNRGFVGSFGGEVDTIEGVARVVDSSTNAKLSVNFPDVLFGLIEGEYWIIDLDQEEYQYAVVSDSNRTTLFILSRTPFMDAGIYNDIIDRLVAQGYIEDLILLTPQQPEEAS